MNELFTYIKNLSEFAFGMLGLFGGFLTKIAPPERSAWIWSGLASVIASVVFLSVKLLVPIHVSAESVHVWTIVAVASCGLGVVFAFLHILIRQVRIIDYHGRETIIGTIYTQRALDYQAMQDVDTPEDTLGGFIGKTHEVWVDVTESRRLLGVSYALMLVPILFGLCLGAELIIHPPSVDPPKPPWTLAQRAVALKEVHFALNESVLSGDAVQNLDDDATLILDLSRRLQGIIVTVEGYCDDQGSARRNVELGFDRAHNAGQELIDAGVPASLLKLSSFGKTSPVCTGTTEACRQKNRRVHLTVSQKPSL
jgi:outer membrane protein OmpA-like peptidoglycan-associated protein